MAFVQSQSKRKPSGARYTNRPTKRLHALGRLPTHTRLQAARRSTLRVKGGNAKVRLSAADTANVYDPKAKAYVVVKIKTVVETPANRHFARRNIMVRGTIIETDKGKARITSRPGQDGVINAVLL